MKLCGNDDDLLHYFQKEERKERGREGGRERGRERERMREREGERERGREREREREVSDEKEVRIKSCVRKWVGKRKFRVKLDLVIFP